MDLETGEGIIIIAGTIVAAPMTLMTVTIMVEAAGFVREGDRTGYLIVTTMAISTMTLEVAQAMVALEVEMGATATAASKTRLILTT
jgi:hypothetical protein